MPACTVTVRAPSSRVRLPVVGFDSESFPFTVEKNSKVYTFEFPRLFFNLAVSFVELIVFNIFFLFWKKINGIF